MEWPASWDQGAWSLALGVLSLAFSCFAIVRSFLVKRRVTGLLASNRLVGALAELERAGEDICHGGSKSAFERGCLQWRQTSPEVRTLLGRSGTSTSGLDGELSVIAGMIHDSLGLISTGEPWQDASVQLRAAAGAATDTARLCRSELQSEVKT